MNKGKYREKGKYKKREKQMSVLFIPHSPEGTGVFKFSTLYRRFYLVLGMMLVTIICLIMLAVYIVRENNSMKNNISFLLSMSSTQKSLLQEKAGEILMLKEKDKKTAEIIKDFVNKYRTVTETYINNNMSSVKTSRSGERSDRSFINEMKELKKLIDTLDNINSDKSNTFVDLSETEDKLNAYLMALPTLWPTEGRISSGYGGRSDPLRFRKGFHEGIDIAAPYGQDIKASGNGKVVYSGYYSGYGYSIIIDHGNGITTVYGHARTLLVKKNQIVKKGDIIARVGSSGRSTGSHLHFEVRINDNPVDPLTFLDKK